MTTKDLSELYQWIRKNNQHTPDEVIDFMYQAARKALLESKRIQKLLEANGRCPEYKKGHICTGDKTLRKFWYGCGIYCGKEACILKEKP